MISRVDNQKCWGPRQQIGTQKTNMNIQPASRNKTQGAQAYFYAVGSQEDLILII